MDPLLEKLDRYYRKTRNKKITGNYIRVLSKDPREFTPQEDEFYRTRILPNRDYFVSMLYQAYVDEGRPLEEWRQFTLNSPPSAIEQIGRRVVVLAIQEADQD